MNAENTESNGRLNLRNARLAGRGGLWDIAITSGRIDTVDAAGGRGASPSLDLAGRLLLPALVDGHIHLDKTFRGATWRPHRPGTTIAERIAAETTEREALDQPMALRAAGLIEHLMLQGTLGVRSHVDIDETIGLAHVEALLGLRDRLAGRVDLQLVAFPQSGIHGRVAQLLEEALRMGVEVIGGLDPAGIDHDIEAHLGTIFNLAERYHARVDIHLHDGGTLGAFELQRIAAHAQARGMQGRVAVSHAFALGMIDADELARTAAALALAGVAIMTNGPGADAMPPVARLLAEGVTVFGGSDNIRDAWSPYGNGDLLARAAMIGYRADFRTDDRLRQAFALVTDASRAVIGLEHVAVAPGSPADLVALVAEDVPEAVATFPSARLVIRKGNVVSGG